MHRLNSTPTNLPFYSQQFYIPYDICLSFPDNQKLLQVLFGHKQLIEKLLENQNVLKSQFDGPVLALTTDTEHSNSQNEFYDLIRPQKPQTPIKQVNTILLKQDRQCIVKERKNHSNKIQIVSTFPLQQVVINEQLQQIDEKKQFQKHPEQNKKCCQTKNIIKNYGKSILMFLRRNRVLAKNIIEQYGYDENQFYQQFENFKDKVNSITELKAFWTEDGNRFAKVYRIVSNIYLKKFSLKHTFSSRVKNYGVHIKYRKRLLDVLKNPEDFSSIKYI